jgi:signal transduction histidine kinase/DNA-binding response OmpR family regulator
MTKKPRDIKFKVIMGYLLLFVTAVVSTWFAYNEILKIALPDTSSKDNDKLLKISTTLAKLYANEALGRTAILTASPRDLTTYIRSTDSIKAEIDTIKTMLEKAQVIKLDTVQMLLARKKDGIKEIVSFQQKNPKGQRFNSSRKGIKKAKDSIWQNIEPVLPKKKYAWDNVSEKLLTEKQRDSLSKLDVSNESLTKAYYKLIDGAEKKDNLISNALIEKEEKLLDENRILSDKLRVIIAAVEKEFLQNSYIKFEKSRATLNKTVETMAWVGAVTLLLIIIFALIIVRDLSNNQNYRRQLEILNQQNQNLLHTKSMLMATVTHDLQTPLGSIIGFQELLKNTGVSARQNQYLNNIKESADYILNLVNDLMDFSRLENNRITIDNKSFNMRQAIEGTCRTLEPIATEKNIELNWDVADELDGNFITDPYRLKQVLTNLISNALKFTHEGSVEVSARIEENGIVISVIDTGIGIAADKHDAVFKEFTQANSGIEKKFGGTGLGLTISKRIAELLKGTISLESQEGKGSIFTVTLPCIPSEVKDETLTLNTPQNNSIITPGTNILVIDDDHVQLMLMKEVLQQYGATVFTEINSTAVTSLLEKGAFDIVLTDIQMPVLDGFGLIKIIRSHKDASISAIPVVALSGRKDLPEDAFEMAGFTAYSSKPVNIDELLGIISGILKFERKRVLPANEDEKKEGGLYSLSSLSQFTNNDPESLKTILETFIESAQDNCRVLRAAAKENNALKLAQIAHKMIPMLRQMEVNSIADMLLPLEEGTHEMNPEAVKAYAEDICKRMLLLCQRLQLEIAG